MPRIKGIVFDKDGTLFDFQATWGAWSLGMLQVEAAGDPMLVERLAQVLGYDLGRKRFRSDSVIADTTDVLADALLPYLPGTGKTELIQRMDARAAQAPQVEAAPLGDLLDRLVKMGLALGIATNDAEASARAHLRAAGVEGAFDFIACHNSGWGTKPDAGQLLAFAHATGLDPAECVMVGDSLHDMMAAHTAGMSAVAVLTGLADRAILAPMADAVLESVADLPAWIAAQG